MKALDQLKHVRDNVFDDETKDILSSIVEVFEAEDTKRKIIFSQLSEGIGEIRLHVKSLAFDLEATRRERDEAISKLD